MKQIIQIYLMKTESDIFDAGIQVLGDLY